MRGEGGLPQGRADDPGNDKALTFERIMGMTDSENNEMKEAPAAVPEPLLKTTIGKITYLVGIHFSEESKETMEDKIRRLIRRDIQTESFE